MILVISNVVDMYWAMEIYGNTCGLAGNYMVEYNGQQVLMAHIDDFTHYAKDGLRKALLQPVSGQLAWLERNDTATRSRMIELTRAPTRMPWGDGTAPSPPGASVSMELKASSSAFL